MGEKINIICWKWEKTDPPSTKNEQTFDALHVNTLYNMLQRHLHIPHQLICITDNAYGIHVGVKVFPMIETFAEYGGCYRRLSLFDPGLNGDYGKRIVCIDLDVVIVDDVTPIFSKEADFIIWGEETRKTPYCGSMWMMNVGSRPKVWAKFLRNPQMAINLSKKKYKVGSDQAFISYCLYPGEETWTKKDGIYNFKLDIMKLAVRTQQEIDRLIALKKKRKKKIPTTMEERAARSSIRRWKQKRIDTMVKAVKKELKKNSKKKHKPIKDFEMIIQNSPTGKLPEDARMVFFNGKHDPSDLEIQRSNPWIKDHWI